MNIKFDEFLNLKGITQEQFEKMDDLEQAAVYEKYLGWCKPIMVLSPEEKTPSDSLTLSIIACIMAFASLLFSLYL